LKYNEKDKMVNRMQNTPEGSCKENPSLEEAYKIIKTGIARHKTVIIAGKCIVDYDGRAASKLDPGERLVIFKSDGSALIHRPRDYSPVNWQPAGSLFRTQLQGDSLNIRVYRPKEKETLIVNFGNVKMVAALDLKDNGEFYLYASERDMQEAILYDPNLLEEGFQPLEAERTVEPGFIDIIGRDKNNTLTIVEIKRNPASKEAVTQLKKYMDIYSTDNGRSVRGILVAPELKKGAQQLLTSLGFEFKALSPQECANILKRKRNSSLNDFFK